jgi:hypothetical protein
VVRVRRWGVGGWTGLLALLLSGCWLQPGAGPQHDRYNPFETGLTAGNVGSLAQSWSVELDATSVSEPLVSDARVFLTTRTSTGSSMRALRLWSGAPVWEHELEAGVPFGLASSATFSGGVLWASHIDLTAAPCPLRLDGVDPDDGALVASSPVNFPISGLVTSGAVAAYTESTECLVNDAPSTLVVRDAATQATQWTAALPGPAGGLVISGGLIYLTSADQVHAFAAEGCGAPTCDPLWVRPGQTSGLVVDGQMFTVREERVDLGHGVVAVGSLVDVLAADTGEVLWTAGYFGGDPFAGMGRGQIIGLAVAHGNVYVAAWRDPSTPGPAVGMLDAYPLGGCGATTCGPAWRGTLPDVPRSAIAVGGEVVYAGVDGATRALVAFDAAGCGAATCAPLATVPTPGAPDNISVGQGTVLVTSMSDSGTTHHLTAFRAP